MFTKCKKEESFLKQLGGGLRSGHPSKSVLQLTNLDMVTRKWTGLSKLPKLMILMKIKNGRWAYLQTRSLFVREDGSVRY